VGGDVTHALKACASSLGLSYPLREINIQLAIKTFRFAKRHRRLFTKKNQQTNSNAEKTDRQLFSAQFRCLQK
jgi:hypothetical protein